MRWSFDCTLLLMLLAHCASGALLRPAGDSCPDLKYFEQSNFNDTISVDTTQKAVLVDGIYQFKCPAGQRFGHIDKGVLYLNDWHMTCAGKTWVVRRAGKQGDGPYRDALVGCVRAADTCVRPEEQKLEYRLEVPYRANFKNTIKIGQEIVVKGFARGSYHAFSINLCGDPRLTAWHFHIIVNWNSNNVKLTYLTNGAWQGIPSDIYTPSPIKRGGLFEVRIRVQEDRFQLSIDGIGKNSYEFKHRLPIDSIKYLMLMTLNNKEDGYVTYVDLGEEKEPFPSKSAIATGFPICMESTCNRCTVIINGVFREGIDGANMFWFDFDLKNGEKALRFHVYFDTSSVEINSHRNGIWMAGSNKIYNNMPFKKNVPFSIAITTEADAFQISVDGVHFATFAHRAPPSDITGITTRAIDDVDIQIK